MWIAFISRYVFEWIFCILAYLRLSDCTVAGTIVYSFDVFFSRNGVLLILFVFFLLCNTMKTFSTVDFSWSFQRPPVPHYLFVVPNVCVIHTLSFTLCRFVTDFYSKMAFAKCPTTHSKAPLIYLYCKYMESLSLPSATLHSTLTPVFEAHPNTGVCTPT